MKILFTSSHINAPSYLFYKDSFLQLRERDGVAIDLHDNPITAEYSGYDVVLFMGYDPQTKRAKQQNRSALIGIVEPRPKQENAFNEVDFIISNGPESRDYFLQFCPQTMIYYVYPQVQAKMPCPVVKDKLVLGYHGNRVNLDSMIPRISDAIYKLSQDVELEFWAMYNYKTLGKLDLLDKQGFDVRHIQFNEAHFASYIAHVDIGIVPQLMPVRRNRLLFKLLGTLRNRYLERHSNYILRFKETINIGRHLVFAQYGIPVIADFTPASAAFMGDGKGGEIAYHTKSWYHLLRDFALNADKRKKQGALLLEKYNKRACPTVQNDAFLDFVAAVRLRKNNSGTVL